MEENILIVTSAVRPIAKDVKLLNVEQRIFETISALENLSNTKIFSQIIICDGSGFDFNNIIADKEFGCDIKALCFTQNVNLVTSKGKSYGEILIYEYLLANANIPDEANVFKISGRWQVYNIHNIVEAAKKYRTAFFTFYPKLILLREYVHTSFYKCNVGMLETIVKRAKQFIEDDHQCVLERAFFNALKPYKKKWININYPIYVGTSGTTNKPLKLNSIKFFEKKVVSKYFGQYCFTIK